MKQILAFLLLFCIVLSGCSKESEDSDAARKQRAEKVIQAMFGVSDKELYSEDFLSYIGIDAENHPVNEEKREEICANWDVVVGNCFAEGMLEEALDSGVLLTYMGEADLEEAEIELESVELDQEETLTEVYQVTWLLGKEQQQVKIFFRFNEAGLIEEVKEL